MYRLEAYVNGRWTRMMIGSNRAEMTKALFALMDARKGWEVRIVNA